MRLSLPGRNGSASIAILLMSMPLLTGCAGVSDLFHFLGGSETTTVVKIECPQLAAPPDAVVDALATVKKDPEAARWIVGLDKHYDKLSVCSPSTGGGVGSN